MKNREPRCERVEQLQEGIEAAAAALPSEFEEVRSQALEAGTCLAARLVELDQALVASSREKAFVGRPTAVLGEPRLVEDADPSETARQIETGVSLLQELHYHLVKVCVLSDSPDELGIPGEVSAALELAEEAGRLLRT